MNITYSTNKNIDAKVILDFFTDSGNPDRKYGEKLVESVKNASVAIFAWDKDEDSLAALITVVDDGIAGYIRYLVVAPNYRGKGINDELIAKVKEAYKDLPYLYNFASDDFHASFFTKMGFKVIDGAKVLTK